MELAGTRPNTLPSTNLLKGRNVSSDGAVLPSLFSVLLDRSLTASCDPQIPAIIATHMITNRRARLKLGQSFHVTPAGVVRGPLGRGHGNPRTYAKLRLR